MLVLETRRAVCGALVDGTVLRSASGRTEREDRLYRLIVSASTSTTTRLAQHQFPGMDADMVNWAGTVGADYGVIAVSKDSPYQSLEELLDTMEQKPSSVSFAGGSASGGR